MEKSAKLVDFILEQEQREKAKRQRRLMIGGITAGVAAIAILIISLLNRPDGFRRYKMDALTVSQVRVLFQEDPRPLLITVPDQKKAYHPFCRGVCHVANIDL